MSKEKKPKLVNHSKYETMSNEELESLLCQICTISEPDDAMIETALSIMDILTQRENKKTVPPILDFEKAAAELRKKIAVLSFVLSQTEKETSKEIKNV